MAKGRSRRHRNARALKEGVGLSVADDAVTCIECGRTGGHADWCRAEEPLVAAE